MAPLKLDGVYLPLTFAAVRSLAAAGPNTAGAASWATTPLGPAAASRPASAVRAAGFDARYAQGCCISSCDAFGIGAATADTAAVDATLVVFST